MSLGPRCACGSPATFDNDSRCRICYLAARHGPMTDAEREAQRQSWARGQSTPGPGQAVVVEPGDMIRISDALAVCNEAVAAERERVLAAVAKWHRAWSASIDDVEADDALDALIAKLRSNTADAQDEKEGA